MLQEYNMKHEKSIACPFCSTFIRFPEAAQRGDDFDCDVCHRTVLLQFDNGTWHGELRAHTQAA
ncbi:MAG: hypothetical protein HC888_19135 [Candidatus Competibacteraceae bacterium]|nr:hypothetical protein [Candidatus Competibacteraceae bacterium]